MFFLAMDTSNSETLYLKICLRLYMNASEVLPRPLSYPATVSNLIRGQTFSFNVDAKQFQEDAQSSNVLIAMPAGRLCTIF